MVKSIYTITLSTMLIFSIGCGGGDNSTTNKQTTLADSYTSWKVAKNNLVQDASEDIGANTMKILIEPTKQIGEDDVSNTVDFVYGKINGQDVYVAINQNYTNGTKMVVRIYDASDNILVTSNELIYTGEDNNIEFSDINF